MFIYSSLLTTRLLCGENIPTLLKGLCIFNVLYRDWMSIRAINHSSLEKLMSESIGLWESNEEAEIMGSGIFYKEGWGSD